MNDAICEPRPKRNERTFLVVVDNTEEMRRALTYACRRARDINGRVALLHVITPADFQQWMTVADLIKDEEREAAEKMLQHHAKQVQTVTGKMAVLFIREGEAKEELLSLLEEEPSISVLVLAASSKGDDPGPLVNYLTGKGLSKLNVPVIIIPRGLPEEKLDSPT